MGRPKNTDARRAQIVGGLRAVMGERGYAGASISRIAAAAGLAPGLVHYHFSSKQEILLALVAELAGVVRDRVARRSASLPTTEPARSWARLAAWIDGHLALGDDHDAAAVACWVVIGSEAVRQPEVAEVYGELLEADLADARDRVAEVLRAVGADPDGAEEIARALLAAVEGTYRLAASAPALVPQGSSAARLHHLARALVTA
jgi:TetR/AcrR family transcriptional repressor of bet genes